ARIFEVPPGILESVDEGVDLGWGVVDEEARARRGDAVEPPHQWLSAVMAGPDGDAVLIEHLTEVVRVNVAVVESDHADALLCARRTVDRDTGDGRKLLHRIGGDL